ncbi:hypothetical protein [Spiroplasma diminutum]|uniref:Uncharacterized protein n=1 Tax=Spiroplasma diminutum CUAS-1 TaxID=1276221 RepID=S5MJT2_9MOLU|nr:hypothetical protein [Spiroplasma diminutum]AGR42210.1 hypothetical protein SDIMI_v3c05060 [Spiroplasma diminutum CUAS-1]
MTIQKINNFENPIFDNYISELNRIYASEIFFKIELSCEEFWTEFTKYIFKNVTTKDFSIENLKKSISLKISDTNGISKNYIITEFEENKSIELTNLNSNETVLTKIYVRTSSKSKNTSVWYLESKRTVEEIDKKTHKKRQNTFNARVINKVILLKDYLLNKVRDYK